MFQMKEKGKASKKELHKINISNLPDKVFKIMIIKILKLE